MYMACIIVARQFVIPQHETQKKKDIRAFSWLKMRRRWYCIQVITFILLEK